MDIMFVETGTGLELDYQPTNEYDNRLRMVTMYVINVVILLVLVIYATYIIVSHS